MRKGLFLLAAIIFTLSLSYMLDECAFAKGKDNIEAKIKKWDKELQLLPEQKAQIQDILTQARQEIKNLKEQYKDNKDKAGKEEIKAMAKEMRIKAHDSIADILTEEQQKKFKQIRAKQKLDSKQED